MNTVSYTDNASRVPVEGPGRFFLPLPSINLPLSGFSAESAGGLEPRGLQPYRHATTFHHLPPQVEGAPKNQPSNHAGSRGAAATAFHSFQTFRGSTRHRPSYGGSHEPARRYRIPPRLPGPPRSAPLEARRDHRVAGRSEALGGIPRRHAQATERATEGDPQE